MSLNVRRIPNALAPTWHVARIGFENKKIALANLRHEVFNPVFDSYEKKLADVLESMAIDIRRVREANEDKMAHPARVAKKKPGKNVKFDEIGDEELDEGEGELDEEELDPEELELVEKMEALQHKKAAAARASRAGNDSAPSHPARKSNMSRAVSH